MAVGVGRRSSGFVAGMKKGHRLVSLFFARTVGSLPSGGLEASLQNQLLTLDGFTSGAQVMITDISTTAVTRGCIAKGTLVAVINVAARTCGRFRVATRA